MDYCYCYYYYYYYHLYAGHLQLYNWNKPCFYGIQCCSCSVFTICATCNVISPVKCVLYFYISTSRSVCAARNMAVLFCSSLISCFPAMLLRYCLIDFETVPVFPINTGIAFAFTFHMRWISIEVFYILMSPHILSWSHFCLQESQHTLTCMFFSNITNYDVQFIVRNSSVGSNFLVP